MRSIVAACIAVLFLYGTSRVCAGDQAPSGSTPVTLAVIGDYPPYDIYQDGQVSGISNDMAKALFTRLDLPIIFRQMPFKRALEALKTGKVDALVGLGKNLEREQYVLYPDYPLAVIQVAFFVRKGSSIGYRGDLREMSGYTIGAVHGFMYSQAFKTLADLGVLRVEESATVQSNIQKLLRKRYDVIVANSAVALYEAKQLGVSQQLEELSPPLDTAACTWAFPRSHRWRRRSSGSTMG